MTEDVKREKLMVILDKDVQYLHQIGFDDEDITTHLLGRILIEKLHNTVVVLEAIGFNDEDDDLVEILINLCAPKENTTEDSETVITNN